MTFFLGLTGGIATGKSTVSQYFLSLGIPVIDADQVARKVVQRGSKGLKKIVQYFGSEMLQADQSLNRKKLGRIIFHNTEKRKLLDTLLDDEIRSAIEQQSENFKQKQIPLVVLDIPLLFERNYQNMVDEIMVVYVPESLQIERLIQRDQITFKEACSKVQSQLPIEKKAKKAQVVINNEGTRLQTQQQLEAWISTHHNKQVELEKK